MSAWLDTDDTVAEEFLKTRKLTEKRFRAYRSVIRSFERVSQRHQALSREMLSEWMRERKVNFWPKSSQVQEIHIVDDFIDYLLKRGLIDKNPIADLRLKHGARGNRPVWRAIASPNPDDALVALRRPAPFGSFLGDFMQNHVTLMRNRGYKYTTEADLLLRFDRFLQASPHLAGESIEKMVAAWAAAKRTPHHAAQCQKAERMLTKARYRIDAKMLPRPCDPRVGQQVARIYRKPHILSPGDVRLMLDVSRSYSTRTFSYRPLCARHMIILAYCAGLRRGEIARLNLGDVDFNSGTITIRDTKFYKTRILPLSDSALSELGAFVDARRGAGASQDPQSALFWHDHPSGRHSSYMVSKMITEVMRQAGLKPLSGRAGPRVHDLRHSMVVSRILEWYRTGVNPQERLRFLSTYMGHRDINSTLVYITVTRDLLHEANERFRAIGIRCLNLEVAS